MASGEHFDLPKHTGVNQYGAVNHLRVAAAAAAAPCIHGGDNSQWGKTSSGHKSPWPGGRTRQAGLTRMSPKICTRTHILQLRRH